MPASSPVIVPFTSFSGAVAEGTVTVNVPNNQEIMFQWSNTAANGSPLLAIDDVVIIPLTGAPVAVSDQASVTVANTDVGQNRTATVRMRAHNLTANATLSLARGASSAFTISSTSLANTALNNITHANLFPSSYTITFRPTTPGVIRDTLIVSGGGLTTPLRIPLSGTGVAVGPPTFAVTIGNPANGAIEV